MYMYVFHMWKFAFGRARWYLPFAVLENLNRIIIIVTITETAEDAKIQPTHIPATAPWVW